MVIDDLHKTDVKSKKASSSADAQTQTEEPAGSEQTPTPESRNRAETELHFLLWKKLCFKEEPETCQNVSTG